MLYRDLLSHFKSVLIMSQVAFTRRCLTVNSIGSSIEDQYSGNISGIKDFYNARMKKFLEEVRYKPSSNSDLLFIEDVTYDHFENNCKNLLDDIEVDRNTLPNLILLEMTLKHIVEIDDYKLSNFIKMMAKTIYPDIPEYLIEQNVSKLRQNALEKINSRLNINQPLIKIDSLNSKIDGLNHEIDDLTQQYDELQSKYNKIKEIKQEANIILQNQVRFLEDMAYEYVVGSEQVYSSTSANKIKPHDRNDFHKIFSSDMFEYSEYFPKLKNSYQTNSEMFEEVLSNIFHNCITNRKTAFIRTPLQAGEMSLYFIDAINANQSNLGIKALRGNARTKEKFASQRLDNCPFNLKMAYESELLKLANEGRDVALPGTTSVEDLELEIETQLDDISERIGEKQQQRNQKLGRLEQKVHRNGGILKEAYKRSLEVVDNVEVMQSQVQEQNQLKDSLKAALINATTKAMKNMADRSYKNTDKYKTLDYIFNKIDDLDQDDSENLTKYFYLLERTASTKRGLFGRKWGKADTYLAISSDLTQIRAKYDFVATVQKNVESSEPAYMTYKNYLSTNLAEIRNIGNDL
ncbi:MAG: hypothetical protein EP298_02740 [Gammaproteobacteria bacterium]|nr:MAG: hypothetical protein EP298_02740 [Gammaproteobacteria bacterium]UTW43397.1 hypothetical protein KFE69_04695 [bacterium SCSIO 12844]